MKQLSFSYISHIKFNPKNRITPAEATVAQKPNQGTNPQKGCNPCPNAARQAGIAGAFFWFFFLPARLNAVRTGASKKEHIL
jgi:hypothetical protein